MCELARQEVVDVPAVDIDIPAKDEVELPW